MSAFEKRKGSAEHPTWAPDWRIGRLPVLGAKRPAQLLDLCAFGDVERVLDINAEVANKRMLI